MTGNSDSPLVFISYRIADTESAAAALARELQQKLEVGEVYLDRLSIDGGDSWPDKIRHGVERAQAVLVLVGPRWLSEQGEYYVQRIAMEGDWVRQEVAAALKRRPEALVLQVLADGQQKAIPAEALRHIPDIQELSNVQAIALRNGRDWNNDLAEILRLLEPFGFKQGDSRHDDRDVVYAPSSKGLFVGRRHNITALQKLVDEEAARESGQRPIGLVGMGGVGKTALAGELIRIIGARYDRVIHMSRPPEGHPKRAISVFREWARDMEKPVDKEYAPAEIRNYLAAHYRSLLVLIDDAWHGDLEELSLINEALPADATRLITTREKNVCIDLEARVYNVEPLRENDAKQLIREQLMAAFADVSKDGTAGVEAAIEEHSAALDLFIQKVEGLPLALRLGIGSCNSLPEIDDVVNRLVASLDRGVDEFRTAAALAVAASDQSRDARNQSLAASLSVSFEDMVQDDQTLGTDLASRFRALSVFPEGCTVDGDFIVSVWSDEPPEDDAALEARKSLVDRCLLTVNVDTGEYSVQSVLRAFALGLLREDPDQLQAVRRRYHREVVKRVSEVRITVTEVWSATDYLYPHLAHVLTELIASIEQVAGGPLDGLAGSQAPDGEWLERLRRAGREDVEIGRGLSAGFRNAASRRPEWGDTGLRLLKLGLLCARADEDHNEEAEFLGRIGDLYTTRDSDLAEKYFTAALDGARQHGAAALADILTFYAESRRTRSDWDGALELAKEALALHTDARNDLREAKTRSIVGEVLWRLARLDDADEQYRRALEIYKREKNDKGGADVLSLMAANEFNRGGRYEQAIELFEKALEKHEALRDLSMKAQDLNDMGACYRYLGQYEKAESFFKQALDLSQLIGNRRLQSINVCNLAGALYAQGQYDLARQQAEKGRQLGEEVDDKVPQFSGRVWEGLAWQGMGEFKTAEASFEKAVELVRTGLKDPRGLAGALGRLGMLYCDHMEKADEGMPLIQEAVNILRLHKLHAALSNVTADELQERLERDGD